MTIKLAILAGGLSHEHSVSLLSAQTIVRAAMTAQFDVRLVLIDRQGRWWQSPIAAFLAQDNDVKTISIPEGSKPLTVQPVPGQFLRQGETPIDVDVVFPITHGTFGEDGSMQGLLQMADLAFVGPDMQGSVNAFDKIQARRLTATTTIPSIGFVAMSAADYQSNGPRLLSRIASQLGMPVFVKASQQGSSVGVYYCDSLERLPGFIEQAFGFSPKVLVEQAVLDARELEVAVLGNDTPQASPVGEIISSQRFYDFDDKYVLGQSKTVAPADLSDALSERIKAMAIEVYRALGLSGMARVDFLLAKDQTPYLIEANTLPGFTEISMYPKLWEAGGLGLPDLVAELVRLAIERHSQPAIPRQEQ